MQETINTIIVGAGYGGLATAIELARKGCKVKVFEAVKNLENKGDVIFIGINATRIMKKWGSILADVDAESAHPQFLCIQDQNGKVLLQQPIPSNFGGLPSLAVHRSRTQRAMYEYAKTLGVEVILDARISEYFESENSAGVIANGEKHIADFVIGADGVHSKARAFVTKKDESAQRSGFAVFRAWFDMERLEGNPTIDWMAKSPKDLFTIWIGQDTHSIITTNNALRSLTCFVTHKDTSDIEESWGLPGKIDDMLAVVKGWDPILVETIKAIPPEVLIDWKLLWRNPVKQWVSEKGRIALVGDAAHPHLATSGNGGAQAIEDAATLGALMQLIGKANIPLSLKAYERMRYERTALTQRMGWETRHRWHQTDWELIEKYPEVLRPPQPLWLLDFDAEKYAYDNYEAVKANLETGAPFKSTNVPEGHVHEDWTIEDMMAKEGMKVEADFYQVKH